MDIQIINLKGNNEKGYTVKSCNTFGNSLSLDLYDLNIIDLSDSEIWKNNESSVYFDKLNIDLDFKTLKQNILNTTKSKVLFILPQNLSFKTDYRYNHKIGHNDYIISVLLKDIIKDYKINLEKILPYSLDIYFEKNITTLNQEIFYSDFYFNDDFEEISTEISSKMYTDKSNKLISFSKDNYTFTTLNIFDDKGLKNYLDKIYCDNETKQPDWFNKIEFFNDSVKKQLISRNNKKIIELNEEISDAERILKENKYYESILYKTGTDLELILRKILKELFHVEEDFVDNKKEDYYFQKNNVHYLFEFKGLSANIRNSNVSQLRTNAEKFAEENEIEYTNCKRILIATRFKDLPIETRPVVHPDVISYAKNEVINVLIIDSLELLKLFEKFRKKEINSETCLKLMENTGLLEVENCEK